MNNLTVLGDTHLGKRFITGVPLHRRGDREAMVWEQFQDSLINCATALHVQTGDLFDQFAVPEALLLAVANTYREAAAKNDNTIYVLYRGNHDASRDTDKASSFDVLHDLLEDVQNVHVLREVSSFVAHGKVYGFIPWHPFKSAEELAVELVAYGHQYVAVFGHFEVDSFGGHDFNLVPTKTLSAVTKLIYTGHIHTPTEFERDGVRVVVVGSMQPYSHGEDPENHWYETVAFDDLTKALSNGVGWVDLNLRVIIRPGEVVPEIDCLSLITKPYTEKLMDDDEPDNMEVNFAEFNMHTLFVGCLNHSGVRLPIAEKILAKYEELKNV